MQKRRPMTMQARTWTCQRVNRGIKCRYLNPSTKRKCEMCGKPRPKRRQPKHRAVLASTTYEQLVEIYGERCGVCGAERKPGGRRLHRDHEHTGDGMIRGLLCYRDNVALRSYMTLEWLRAAVAYLERAEANRAEPDDKETR